jgi:hypothetical protein
MISKRWRSVLAEFPDQAVERGQGTVVRISVP